MQRIIFLICAICTGCALFVAPEVIAPEGDTHTYIYLDPEHYEPVGTRRYEQYDDAYPCK